MRHLNRLMLSRPYCERVPDQSLILDNGVRYDRVLATRGRDYAMAYSYTGRPFRVRLGAIEGQRVRAAWYSTRTGETQAIGDFANRGERRFVPPGTPAPGNDRSDEHPSELQSLMRRTTGVISRKKITHTK